MEGYIGQIMMFGGNFAPRNWAFCHGQLMSIAQNQATFSILGTAYGGDGRTTFGLPDLRGRVPLGEGAGPGLPTYSLGQRGGAYQTVLNQDNMAPHSHAPALHVSSANASQNVATAGATVATPGTVSGRSFVPTAGFNTATPDIAMNSGSISSTPVGRGVPFNNMQPFQAMNYVICISGLYPSRN